MSSSIRIPANGIKVFFIQKEYTHSLSKMKSIQLSSGKDSLYISHNWRDSLLSAISKLKQLLLQQIFGDLFLNMKKHAVRTSISSIIQIIIFNDFFIRAIMF
jgi:hypothetical protein